ncbi:hypothetical protein OHI65_07030 [Brucella sp. MAB-22]|uniref:hypothetical protein n=1 Tax=Brucella sp. MAB-22 TaxID=2986424 RepID=UPI002220CC10|nr:hypothetical protein [Brucella sp. MAB-22]UYT54127.1 hypothetical protein OHI65_07030 [Brucella sp. MAB-22]
MAFEAFSGSSYYGVNKPIWVLHNDELPSELGKPVIDQRFETFSFFRTKRPIRKCLNGPRFTYLAAGIASSLAAAILGAQDFLQRCHSLPNPTLDRVVVVAPGQLKKPTFAGRDDFGCLPFSVLHQIPDFLGVIHRHWV